MLLELEILLEKISLFCSTTIYRVKVGDHKTMPPIPDVPSSCLGNTFTFNHTSSFCHLHTKTGSIRHFISRGIIDIVFSGKKMDCLTLGSGSQTAFQKYFGATGPPGEAWYVVVPAKVELHKIKGSWQYFFGLLIITFVLKILKQKLH